MGGASRRKLGGSGLLTLPWEPLQERRRGKEGGNRGKGQGRSREGREERGMGKEGGRGKGKMEGGRGKRGKGGGGIRGSTWVD